LAEIDSIEQSSHVIDTADSDSDLSNLPMSSRMIRVEAELGWKVECRAESSFTVGDQIFESPVGFFG
jgi:hypothetical protein